MGRIAVVTDSAACIPPDLLEQYNIHVVPFRLISRGSALRDGIDITAAEVYQRLRVNPGSFTSSQPSLDDFRQSFEALSDTAEGIVSIHIPERISGTFQAARLAAETWKLPIPVRVLDCGTAAAGQGLIVVAAARAAAAGASFDQVVQIVQTLSTKTILLASLTDLSYIQRGGRVRAVLAIVGSMLKIVPTFCLEQGQIKLFTRARTQAAALEDMLQEMERRVESVPIHAAILHGDLPAEAAALRERVAQHFQCVELWISQFTPVMGAHTGPGVIGVAFYPEDASGRD